MFVGFVRYALYLDAIVLLISLAIALLFFALFVYFLRRGEKINIGIAVATILFFLVIAGLNFYLDFPFFYDYIHYLRYGDFYVMQAVCLVTDTYDISGRGDWDLEVHFVCADGQEFVSKHQLKYRRLGWRWAQAKQNLLIYYLPRSRLILKAVPIE